ncbi:hypothetical protein B9479_001460 [Cryptococcus floricola]|uniref:SAP domain-containing protein n=1 Tax=Cryptococcus floricola TaxID=2591691 RepID=A0A5D3B6L1_9TREE|nr:hypothetical protein B9479_001460 [Cryptococcus floricola]
MSYDPPQETWSAPGPIYQPGAWGQPSIQQYNPKPDSDTGSQEILADELGYMELGGDKEGQGEEEWEVAGDSPWPVDVPGLPKISKKNTVDELREALQKMGLSPKGKKETLYRRAQTAVQAAALAMAPPPEDPSTPLSDSDNPWAVDFPSESVLAAHFAEKERRRAERQQMKESGQKFRSFLCFDVEATCRGGKEFDWPNEIIEFPVVLVRWGEPDEEGKRVLEKVDTFRSYVRPTWQPVLTDFCKALTGITQEIVDASPTFPEVLKELEIWLDKWDLRGEKGLKDAIWVTDGPWDLRDFVPKQLHITPPNPYPNFFHGPYLNIKHGVQSVMSEINRRRAYADAHPDNAPNERAIMPITTSRRGGKWRPGPGAEGYGAAVARAFRSDGAIPVTAPSTPTRSGAPDAPGSPSTPAGQTPPRPRTDYYLNIAGMCEALGLGEFEGRQHSGLDDATNIARILIKLSEKNVIFEANGLIEPTHSGKRYAWMGESGKVIWEDWMSSQKPQEDPVQKELDKQRNIEEAKRQKEEADRKKAEKEERKKLVEEEHAANRAANKQHNIEEAKRQKEEADRKKAEKEERKKLVEEEHAANRAANKQHNIEEAKRQKEEVDKKKAEKEERKKPVEEGHAANRAANKQRNIEEAKRQKEEADRKKAEKEERKKLVEEEHAANRAAKAAKAAAKDHTEEIWDGEEGYDEDQEYQEQPRDEGPTDSLVFVPRAVSRGQRRRSANRIRSP